jgi:S1-C subfamily serine protease
MKKIGIVLVMFCALAFGGEPIDSLEIVAAPAEEFVRMPVRYILQKLARTADNSGNTALSGFTVRNDLPGVNEKRVTLNLEGLTLYQAFEAVAAATGAGVEYSGHGIVLKNPSDIVIPEEPVSQIPVEEEKGDDTPITFSDIDNALIFIESGDSRGSGFVAEMDEKTYLISNQHNFLGASKIRLRAMHGGTLDPEAFEYCETRDLVRFKLKSKDVEKLRVLPLADENPKIGQPVTVYGNSAGSGVATELKGKVMGVGPSEIEVDADIVSGNSGSPILDTTGRVLGVATYITFSREFSKEDARNEIFKGTRFNKARRYGVRIPDHGWVEVSMQKFLNQTHRIVDLQNYIEVMYILVQYWNGNEDFMAQARRLMSVYGSSAMRVKPPYEFNSDETEQDLTMMVKAFSRNYDEFIAKASDMQLTKNELNDLNRNFGKKSTNQLESLDYRIRTLMINKANRMQDQLDEYDWMSTFLEKSAEPLEGSVSEIIRVLDSSENPYIRLKRIL